MRTITVQALCRGRGLGGKDSKDNLRAKLLRSVRQELGLPVYSPETVGPGSVRLPQQMSEEELRHLFDSRWVGGWVGGEGPAWVLAGGAWHCTEECRQQLQGSVSGSWSSSRLG